MTMKEMWNGYKLTAMVELFYKGYQQTMTMLMRISCTYGAAQTQRETHTFTIHTSHFI